jgi:hypothetical protein
VLSLANSDFKSLDGFGGSSHQVSCVLQRHKSVLTFLGLSRAAKANIITHSPQGWNIDKETTAGVQHVANGYSMRSPTASVGFVSSPFSLHPDAMVESDGRCFCFSYFGTYLWFDLSDDALHFIVWLVGTRLLGTFVKIVGEPTPTMVADLGVKLSCKLGLEAWDIRGILGTGIADLVLLRQHITQ